MNNKATRTYKRKFNDKEMNIFNTMENELVRQSTMSVYSYFMKLIEEDGVNGELLISYRKFIKRYNYYHKKICLSTMKNRIDCLEELGLLLVRKESRKTYFKLTTSESVIPTPAHIDEVENEEMNNKMNDTESPLSPETTSIKADDTSCKTETATKNIIDIDSNNNQVAKSGIPYETYKEIAPKVTDIALVCSRARELCKELGIRTAKIVNAVIGALIPRYRTITVAHLDNYIRKVIIQKRETHYKNFYTYVAPTLFAVPKPRRQAVNERMYTDEELRELEELANVWIE